jgi:hypothetical protein
MNLRFVVKGLECGPVVVADEKIGNDREPKPVQVSAITVVVVISEADSEARIEIADSLHDVSANHDAEKSQHRCSWKEKNTLWSFPLTLPAVAGICTWAC